jgi:hypothetical protein
VSAPRVERDRGREKHIPSDRTHQRTSDGDRADPSRHSSPKKEREVRLSATSPLSSLYLYLDVSLFSLSSTYRNELLDEGRRQRLLGLKVRRETSQNIMLPAP